MSLGMPEILIIFFIILLLFGAKKLPELAKGLGKGLKEFKQAAKEPEIEEKKSEIESAEKKE
jgi:sec-independent protein translocase protein TatA